MKNWFLGQGIPLYAETVLLLAGLLALWMTGRIYKRLIREADLMGTSNQRLIKYIKLKVTSYYKIGMHPEDTQALIGRYIKKYRTGPFSMQGWSRLPYLLMTGMLAVGGGNLLYRWTPGRDRLSDRTDLRNIAAWNHFAGRYPDVYGFSGKGTASDPQHFGLCG